MAGLLLDLPGFVSALSDLHGWQRLLGPRSGSSRNHFLVSTVTAGETTLVTRDRRIRRYPVDVLEA